MCVLVIIDDIDFQKLGRGEMSEDDDPFGKGTGEARDDIAAMDRQDATLVSYPAPKCLNGLLATFPRCLFPGRQNL